MMRDEDTARRAFWAQLRELWPGLTDRQRHARVYRVLDVFSINEDWIAKGNTWEDALERIRQP